MPLRRHLIRDRTRAEAAQLKAAQYVRASTSHQKFSIENQQQVICEYARVHEIHIVRTYADPAKSGLFLKRRTGLQRLIADVQGGRADFNVILVYDISRWGRFQDTDESAYYEFICKKAGITIRYCAELFENTGGLFDNLMKHLKRTMAAEYSRDLSSRISIGHQRLASLGLHQGGPANIGLRRILVDEQGRPRGELEFGQRKCLSTDRVVLAPGPQNEIKIVQEIFRLFVKERLSQRRIACSFNDRGIMTAKGYRWSGESVYRVLTCEKYIGTFVYRQSSYRLSSKRIWQPRNRWIRVPGAIKPIIEADIFNTAQHLICNAGKYDRNHLLDCLTAALCTKGYLSAKAIASLKCMPTITTYFSRFGSLSNAYALIGYKNRHKYRFNNVADLLRRLDREIANQIISAVEGAGGGVMFDSKTEIFILDNHFHVALRLVPHVRWPAFVGWRLVLGRMPPCNAVLVGRLNGANTAVLDFHLISRTRFQRPTFHITDRNVSQFKDQKVHALSEFYRHYRRHFLCAAS